MKFWSTATRVCSSGFCNDTTEGGTDGVRGCTGPVRDFQNRAVNLEWQKNKNGAGIGADMGSNAADGECSYRCAWRFEGEIVDKRLVLLAHDCRRKKGEKGGSNDGAARNGGLINTGVKNGAFFS